MTSKRSNIFEVIFGRSHLKWDAYWQLFAWMCDPTEGHGIGNAFIAGLTQVAFGEPLEPVSQKIEFKLKVEGHKGGKWPDFAVGHPDLKAPTHIILMDDVGLCSRGSSKKLNNLQTYIEAGSKSFTNAKLRLIVITDARSLDDLCALKARLGDELQDHSAATGWKLLPLHLTAEWVSGVISRQSQTPLAEYCDWAASLGR